MTPGKSLTGHPRLQETFETGQKVLCQASFDNQPRKDVLDPVAWRRAKQSTNNPFAYTQTLLRSWAASSRQMGCATMYIT